MHQWGQCCQMAKSDSFLSLDCAWVEGRGSHPKKGRNHILLHSGRAKRLQAKNLAIAIWQPWMAWGMGCLFKISRKIDLHNAMATNQEITNWWSLHFKVIWDLQCKLCTTKLCGQDIYRNGGKGLAQGCVNSLLPSSAGQDVGSHNLGPAILPFLWLSKMILQPMKYVSFSICFLRSQSNYRH